MFFNDPAYNQFEVLIEKINGRLCFSAGWLELHNVYDLQDSGFVTLINIQPARSVIQVKDHYGEEIVYPKYSMLLFQRLNRLMFPEHMGLYFVMGSLPIPYAHDLRNFTYSSVKFLSEDDVQSDFLVVIILTIIIYIKQILLCIYDILTS